MSSDPDERERMLADAWHKADAEAERLRRENDILRGIAAKIMPCHYCGVDSIGKCPRGFPGCALADDILVAEERMADEIVRLRTALELKESPRA